MRHVQEELAPVIKKLNDSVPKSPTKDHLRFIDRCEVIRQAPTNGEVAFMARQLIQCTLPHSNPGDVPRWMRRNGNASLVLRSGWDEEKDEAIGYPYGTVPRLVLFWIIREVLRTKSRRLEIGHSLSDFMRELGMTPASEGGHAARRLKEQMRRLFNCRISFQATIHDEEGNKRGERKKYMEVAPDSELWWDLKRPAQSALFESWIEVGEKFYEAILESPVPVDMRALHALKNSALALDLYSLCVWKAYEAQRTGKKQSMAWSSLMVQMGCEYSGADAEKNFKRVASAALTKVKWAYPALATRKESGGFSVLPASGLAISRRKKLTS